MAGAGFKDFAVGEVLTASDVDTYLMQQSVMRFADDGARGSALGTAVGTAVALAEGMVSYLDDANVVQVYDGSGWASPIPGIGSNVVQTVKADTFSASVAGGGTTSVTGLTVSITPTSDASKVLVSWDVSGDVSDDRGWHLVIERDGTPIGIGDAAGSRTRVTSGGVGRFVNNMTVAAGSYLDSPATSSSVTYSVVLHNARSSTQTLYVNRQGADTDFSDRGRSASRITAIEVAA